MELTALQITADTLIFILIGLVAWIGQRAIHRLDKHLDECSKRAVGNAKETQWVGDCMVLMGEQMKLQLPKRPYVE